MQLWAGLAAAGLAADRAAAVVALALVAVQSSLPRVATELAGLGWLADAVADGGAVRGDRIHLAADQARELLAALLAGTGAAVALAVARLAGGGGVTATVLAVLLAAALLLGPPVLEHRPRPAAGGGRAGRPARGRGRAGPRHRRRRLHDPAGPAGRRGRAGRPGRRPPGPPARARIRVAMERAETAMLLGCGVAALATFDAYGLAFAIVR